ncbi:DUF4282 domain-containing protein [Arsenicitalea aurantiaca]|uniref:DUF4282 domain-containing protein n=1 Tax=Arsenicitalea aurantiaca TaxID=1783274 RepID=A0A433XFX2_9HYPH|nr:DUF4282 domain-containing protein [Arsenicitalea aurantiaca]RUT32966.1 DUF4282 domain-containing protein [Arsenicitalea aurantiaca]
MTINDLRKLFTGTTLFRLDIRIARRLMPILYALGLAGLLLWAVRHFFSSFALGFDDGLWGILEIAVFGLLGVVALRVACEALLIYFRGHEEPVEDPLRGRVPTSLLEEVREAIRDLADEEEDEEDGYFVPSSTPSPTMPPPPPAAAMPPARPVTPTAPATPIPPAPPAAKPAPVAAPEPTPRKTPIRRTAKRTPKPKSGTSGES